MVGVSNFNINNPNKSQRLIDPFIRITIGKDSFTIGDNKLIKALVTLGEGKVQSNCRFSIYDPKRELTDKYFGYVEKVGGLDPIETTSGEPSTSEKNIITSEPEQTNNSPGKVIFENVKASTYGYGESTQGGEKGAYGDTIMWGGMYAAMVNTKYKYAQMRVTNLSNNKSVIVKIIDRGPFAVGSNGQALLPLREHPTRKIDLVPGAWKALTNGASPGVINVSIEWLEPTPVASNSSKQNLSKIEAAEIENRKTKSAVSKVDNSSLNPTTRSTLSINSSSSPIQEPVINSKSLAGSQITVELGYGGKTIAAASFIHTGLRYSLFEPHTLEFSGQAASWVLTQRIKNTVYTNLTFKKIAQKITSAYGMKLEMPEEGPQYNYFPQRGITDYEALLIEARRIGYRVYTKGLTLYIQPRKNVLPEKGIFVLEYGSNMGTNFEVAHEAQKDSTGGARSTSPGANNSTGERKFEIDPDSGKLVQKRKENLIGTGNLNNVATTGSPLPVPTPKTTGETDTADNQRKANEDRIKGIIANAEFPTTPEALTLDPDTPFLTKGISTFLDRMWVVETVTHTYDAGKFTTKVTCYSPLKNKNGASPDVPSTNTNSTSNSTVNSSNSNKYIIPTKGVYSSPYGMRTLNGVTRMHSGIDIANAVGTPIYASAAGTVSFTGSKGGYGTTIILNHSNNEQTLYGHLSQILVSNGQQVNQGQLIAKMGSTGYSTGNHLHWEIRVSGTPINPASRVKLPKKGDRV